MRRFGWGQTLAAFAACAILQGSALAIEREGHGGDPVQGRILRYSRIVAGPDGSGAGSVLRVRAENYARHLIRGEAPTSG